MELEESPQTPHEGDAGRNMRAGMSYVIMKMYSEASGVYHVLCVVNTLQRILDMKQPLLMWGICPLQAQIACRKTVRAGGFICAG